MLEEAAINELEELRTAAIQHEQSLLKKHQCGHDLQGIFHPNCRTSLTRMRSWTP